MVIFRNILAVIGGRFFGSLINLNLIDLGNTIYRVKGLDANDMDAYAAIIPT